MKIQYYLSVFLIMTGCAQKSNFKKDNIKRPNILLIVADDLGYSDLGIYGSEIQTPNIDAITQQGVQFTNFHAGSACSPSRAMLLTGIDNHKVGLGNMLEIQAENQFGKPGYEGYLNQKATTVASLLKKEGYHTYMAGKWHLGKTSNTLPYARGFEQSFSLMESGADNWEIKSYAPLYQNVHFYENEIPINQLPKDYFSSDFFSSKIIEYISQNTQDNKPFFAYLSFQAVHMPHQAPLEFIDKYNGVYDEGWEKIREKRLNNQKSSGVVYSNTESQLSFKDTSHPDWQLTAWNSLSDEEKKYKARQMQTYAGMVDNMDYNIGRVVSYLKETGEYENTIIIIMSDNGADPNNLPSNPAFKEWYTNNYPYTYIDDFQGDYSPMGQKGSFSSYGSNWASASNTPMSYFKAFSNEGGLRVPFIISYPQMISTNKVTHEFCYITDVTPTILEFSQRGKSKKDTSDDGKYSITGSSLYSFLMNEQQNIHSSKEIICYELAGSSAVFKDDFKLVRNPAPKGNGEWELYNISVDPSEKYNRAEVHPTLVEEMKDAYEKYKVENGVIEVPSNYNPLHQLIKNSSYNYNKQK